MKKYLVAAAFIGAMGFTGVSMANARGFYGSCYGGWYCDIWPSSDKDDEKASSFFEETKELRKEIVVKRSELDALMRQDNPDEKKAAELTGELFDLRSQMEEKAGKAFAGAPRPGYGPGPGWLLRRTGSLAESASLIAEAFPFCRKRLFLGSRILTASPSRQSHRNG